MQGVHVHSESYGGLVQMVDGVTLQNDYSFVIYFRVESE